MDNPKNLFKVIKIQSIVLAVLLGLRILLAGFVLLSPRTAAGLAIVAAAAVAAAFLMRYLCSNIWETKAMLATNFMVAEIASDLFCLLIFLLIFRKKCLFVTLWMWGLFAVAAFGLLMLYGSINEKRVVRHELNIASPKLKREYKIIQISDIHYATIQKEKVLEETVKRINAEHADAVLIAGDIAEENTPGEKISELFQTLGKLSTVYGTYFVHGNHDRQEKLHGVGRTYTDEEFAARMEEAGIICLDDRAEIINDEICILGREDFSVSGRMKIGDLINLSNDKMFSIVMEHQPTDIGEMAERGIELCLAGHYHGAQNLTNNVVYALSEMEFDGLYQRGEMALYVNAGIAGSKYPVRTHSHNEYLVINLKPGL